MSKILDATCDASGKVTADGAIVPEATVLSEGKQASSGVLLIEEDRARYITSSATDIKTTIEKTITCLTDLSSALTEIATALTSIGAGMTGPTTAPPPTLPTAVTNITSKVSAIATTKSELEQLKGALK